MNLGTNNKEQIELERIPVSIQDNVFNAKNLRTVSLYNVFNEIRTSDEISKLTEKLRAIQDEKEQQEFKKNNLPYFIIATFKDSHRKKEKLISSSCFVFDYDHLDENLEVMKAKLKDDPSVFAFFVSPRGNGLKVIYKLKNAIVDHDIFSAVYKHYAKKFNIDLGVEPDKTSDASRACFLSYDPDLYVNVDAIPLETDVADAEVKIKQRKLIPGVSGTIVGNRTVTATQLVGYYIATGVEIEKAIEHLFVWNLLNNLPMAEEELRNTATSMYEQYQKKTNLLPIKFKVRNNAYMKTIKKGEKFEEVMTTSFKIVPKELLVLETSDCLKCDIISSQGNTYKNVLIENVDWHTKQKFLKALGHQDCVFLGSENDLQALCQFTQLNIPLRKTGTKVVGLKDDIWVVEGLNITPNKISDELSIVPFEKGSDAFYHRIKYQTLPDSEYKSMISSFYDNILQINERNKVLPYLGWIFAVPLKQRIQSITGSFPLLFHHGGQGSGKTSQAELFARLCGYSDPKPNSVTMRSFPMLKLLSSTNGIPQWYDEFKVSDMKETDVENVLRFMRKSYSGEQESKGRADQTIENYTITAPMVVMGEWNINQPAIMERVVLIRSTDIIKKDNSMQEAFATVKELPVEAFMPEYIKYCLGQDIKNILSNAKTLVNDSFKDITVAPRIINNMAVMISGLELFRGFANLHNQTVPVIDYKELLDDQLLEITGAKNGMVKSAVDQLIEELAIMAAKEEIKEGQDYKVVKSKAGFDLLAIKFKEVFRTFKVYAKKTGYEGDLLDEVSYYKLFDNCEYVHDKQYGTKFIDGKSYRCLGVDISKAKSLGLDLYGFENSGYNGLQIVTNEMKPKLFGNNA